MPRPYNRKKPIEIGPYQEVNAMVIPDLSIQEVEAIWRQCCPMPGFSPLDIHQFSKEIILKLREKANGINHS
jgi:hypothetical protein